MPPDVVYEYKRCSEQRGQERAAQGHRLRCTGDTLNHKESKDEYCEAVLHAARAPIVWPNVRHERHAQAGKIRRSMSTRWKGWASLRCRTVLSYSSVRTC
jgi:hypothetical protein